MPAGPFDVQGAGACVQPASNLVITEYVEGSGNNKALELTNLGNGPADLDALGVTVSVYFNGNSAPNTVVNLSGVVAPGETFVLADDGASGAVLAAADQITSSSLWNGDDAVVLTVDGDVADSIGQVGVDPGSFWGSSATVKTQNQTLQRDPASPRATRTPSTPSIPPTSGSSCRKTTSAAWGTDPSTRARRSATARAEAGRRSVRCNSLANVERRATSTRTSRGGP